MITTKIRLDGNAVEAFGQRFVCLTEKKAQVMALALSEIVEACTGQITMLVLSPQTVTDAREGKTNV